MFLTPPSDEARVLPPIGKGTNFNRPRMSFHYRHCQSPSRGLFMLLPGAALAHDYGHVGSLGRKIEWRETLKRETSSAVLCGRPTGCSEHEAVV